MKDKKKERDNTPEDKKVLSKEDFLKTLKKVIRPVEKKEKDVS